MLDQPLPLRRQRAHVDLAPAASETHRRIDQKKALQMPPTVNLRRFQQQAVVTMPAKVMKQQNRVAVLDRASDRLELQRRSHRGESASGEGSAKNSLV